MNGERFRGHRVRVMPVELLRMSPFFCFRCLQQRCLRVCFDECSDERGHMTTWRVFYKQTEYRRAIVQADTEEEARGAFTRGEVCDDAFGAAENREIYLVERRED